MSSRARSQSSSADHDHAARATGSTCGMTADGKPTRPFTMNNDNPQIQICPGITRQTLAHGATMYQMLATLEPGAKMAEHQHPQEQIVHILEGRMRLIVNGVP